MINSDQDIYIIGANGFASEVLCLLRNINNASKITSWKIKAFVDNSEKKTFYNLPVITDKQFLQLDKPCSVVIAIGDPILRTKIINQYTKHTKITYPNLIHPQALIQDESTVRLGRGNIICAGSILTTNIQIGDFNVINLSCTIGHDVVMGNNNVINPSVNISGGVHIKGQCLVGTGAQILQGLKIEGSSSVGAGAVVVKSVEENSTVVGIPARKIK